MADKLTAEEISLVNWQEVGPLIYDAIFRVFEDEKFDRLDFSTCESVEDTIAQLLKFLKPDAKLRETE